MRRAWAAGLALLSAVALGGCGDSRESDDAVVPASGAHSLEGDTFEVMLPSGQFTFTVTEPRDALAEDDAADGEPREAPDGQRYVGLQWEWQGMAGRAFSLLNHDVPPQVASVSVATGNDEIPVFELDTQAGQTDRAWVLVPDDAHPSIHVTYDGHTQTVDVDSGAVEPGVAEGFYDLAGYTADCPDQGPGSEGDGLRYRIECTVGEAYAVPYVADLGWAEEGQIWLLAQVELKPGEFSFAASNESTRYRVDREDGSISVEGGGDPEELWQAENLVDGFGATYAVPVPVDGPWQLDITRTYDLTRDGVAPGAPATEHVSYHSSVTIGS
jgi:hypothetical protein